MRGLLMAVVVVSMMLVGCGHAKLGCGKCKAPKASCNTCKAGKITRLKSPCRAKCDDCQLQSMEYCSDCTKDAYPMTEAGWIKSEPKGTIRIKEEVVAPAPAAKVEPAKPAPAPAPAAQPAPAPAK